jgi:3-oxoacyl-[acyl-carrier protein] reductase
MKRTAVVTGGSRGIGRAISLELASSGARIVLTCQKDLARAEQTAEEIRRAGGEALALTADVLKVEEVKALAERVSADFGGAEILVNNAGVIKDALFPFMKEEDWDYVVDVDLKGAFRVTKALIRGMLHKGWGRIVNVVSVSGISGHVGQTNYSAAKGGLIAFTKALSQELAPRGITVNAGPRPGGHGNHRPLEGTTRAASSRAGADGRFGRPEEVAAVVGFLTSEKAFT